jgi:uncharacterized protein (DUF488 family)
MDIWDIGHSTRTEKEFIALLREKRIEAVADVRRFPSSKKFPHFGKEHLAKVLRKISIDYLWLGEKLGGFRKGGYENWVKTDEFAMGISQLEDKAHEKRTVFMCAEADFARCHRKFIIQSLELKGWTVHHISSLSKPSDPFLTSPLFSDKE